MIGLFLALQISGASAAAPIPIFIVVRDGVTSTSVPVTISGGEPSVRADALMRAMKGTLITGTNFHYTLALSRVRLDLIDGIPFAKRDTLTIPLTRAPQVRGGQLYLPFQFVTEVIPRYGGYFYDMAQSVLMTRTTDTLIALSDRGRIANSNHGDVFISIHCNAPGYNTAAGARERGFETYFLAEAKTEDERRVQDMENESVKFETGANAPKGDPLSFIITDMAQNEHLRESSDLAETLQTGLIDVHPGPNRGVQQANFAVLRGSYMPAVLIEIGFGSNQSEVTFLSDQSNQRALAKNIAESIVAYLAHYES